MGNAAVKEVPTLLRMIWIFRCRYTSRSLLTLIILLLPSCGLVGVDFVSHDSDRADSATTSSDTGIATLDTATTTSDTGTTMSDMATTTSDTVTAPTDTTTTSSDTDTVASDTGVTPSDTATATSDTGATTSDTATASAPIDTTTTSADTTTIPTDSATTTADMASDTQPITDTGTETETDSLAATDSETASDAQEPCPSLPGGTALLSESDLSGYSRSGEMFSSAVAVSGESFSETWEMSVGPYAGDPNQIQLYHSIDGDILTGDHLVFEFWTRCEASGTGTCQGSVEIERSALPYENLIAFHFSANAAWVQHLVPFVALTDYSAGEAQVAFGVGYNSQTIQIAPLRLINYGQLMPTPRPDCLPDTTNLHTTLDIATSPRTVALVDIEYVYQLGVNGEIPLTGTVEGLPSWAKFDADRMLISGIPRYSDLGMTGAITFDVSNDIGSTQQVWRIDVQVDPALLGHWPLDASGGTLVNDATGNNRHGTLFGDVAWLPTGGEIDGALQLENSVGDLDYVALPADAEMDVVQQSNYTVSAWVNPLQTPSSFDPTDNDYGYGIVVKAGGHTGLWYGSDQKFHAVHGFDGSFLEVVSNGIYPPGEFHHVAMCYNPDFSFMHLTLYINGNFVAFDTLNGDEVEYSYGGTPWRIGIGDPGASEGGLFGDIIVDDVRIYTRGLDTVEVKNLNGVQIQY